MNGTFQPLNHVFPESFDKHMLFNYWKNIIYLLSPSLSIVVIKQLTLNPTVWTIVSQIDKTYVHVCVKHR